MALHNGQNYDSKYKWRPVYLGHHCENCFEVFDFDLKCDHCGLGHADYDYQREVAVANMPCVIAHHTNGIYLGNCLGLGFWSKLDPAGQNAAVTFPNEDEAKKHISSWDQQIDGLTFPPIVPDDGMYASVTACISAGLEGWNPES